MPRDDVVFEGGNMSSMVFFRRVFPSYRPEAAGSRRVPQEAQARRFTSCGEQLFMETDQRVRIGVVVGNTGRAAGDLADADIALAYSST